MEEATEKKPSLAELHDTIVSRSKEIRDKVKSVLGLKTDTTFYAILKGQKTLTTLEKGAIAEIYGRKVEDIDWSKPENIIC